ncbi:MAG TPA: asparaginase [Xanthobacteraceae bacterium]|nr:asparaginase [Xanthobacteraceae bacterium]
MSHKRHVVIVGTGGTIASRYDAALGRTVASQTVEAILSPATRRDDLPELVFENFSTIPGFNMTLAFVAGLVRRLRELLDRPEIDGVVVTQGTDTMEETCFLASLLIDSEKPIVFTGAQLPHDHPQTDGPRNLIDAVRTAAAEEARDLGAMICFNGELHAAREVTKVHTSAVETFQSYHHGALGIVDGSRVIIYRRPKIPPLHLRPEQLDKRVEILKAAIGADGKIVDSVRQMSVDGLVVEAFGRGNVSAEFAQALGRACHAGLPVVITSRCPVGRVSPVYGGGGGGRDLEDFGAIFAGDLKGPKARLLLIAALGDPAAHGRIQELFNAVAP